MKRKAHSDPADLNELIRLYEDEGLSLRAIAARIGVSFQRVHERLSGAGVRFRPVASRTKHPIEKGVIADLHVKKRLSISEILEQLGTTENHVRTSMEVHEIKPLTISKLSALAKLPVGETLEMPRPGRRRYYSTIYSRARRAGIRVSIRTGMIEMIKGQGYEVIRAKDEPITAVLNNRERETIDWVLENFGKMSAADISEFSHREKAYRFTKGGELIAYEYAKFFQKLPTPRGH